MAYYHNPRPKKEPKQIIEKPKAPMGRPKKIVDLNVAENLAKKQLLQAEIAAILGITVETLNSRISDEFNETFSEWRTRVCAAGLGKLRESMWDQAVGDKPNTIMQIWLSKQYLGMRDSFEEERPPIKPVMIVWQDKTIELSSTEIKELSDGKETSTETDAET